MTALDTERFLDQARKLTEKRMAAAENIAAAIRVRVEAENALKDARAAERKAFTEAEKNGWTKTELNKLKTTKKRSTPRARNAALNTDPNETSNDANDDSASE